MNSDTYIHIVLSIVVEPRSAFYVFISGSYTGTPGVV